MVGKMQHFSIVVMHGQKTLELNIVIKFLLIPNNVPKVGFNTIILKQSSILPVEVNKIANLTLKHI